MGKCCSYKITVFFLLQVFTGILAYAQDIPMKHYSVRDGLPSGTIYSMLSDTRGYMWFATDAGVSRFDGHRFTNFTLADGLSDNEVMKIAEDSRGRIWFLGLSGTLCYYYNDKFFNPSNDTVLRNAKCNSTYVFFFEDRRHRLWFANFVGYTVIDGTQVKKLNLGVHGIYGEGIVMEDGHGDIGILPPDIHRLSYLPGLYILRDKETLRYDLRYTKEIRSRFVYLGDGSLLFVSREGIVLQKDTAQKLIIPATTDLLNVKILGLSLSSDNLLWVQTVDKGVFCYDYKDLTRAPKRYLEHTGIADAAEDNEHNIWIATFGDGVYILSAGYKSVNNYYTGGTEKHNVYCVAKDGDGNVYTGHDDLVVNIIKHGVFSGLFFKDQNRVFGMNRITKLLIRGENMWIGSDDGLTHIINHNSYNTVTEAILQLPPGQKTADSTRINNIKDVAWYNNDVVACAGGAIYMTDTALHSDHIVKLLTQALKRHYCVYTDKRGIIWYAMSDGLYSLNGKEETNHTNESIYFAGSIYDISETEDSVLILASYGNGILFYKNGKVLQHLTENEGLSGNLCKRIFVHKNEIYVAASHGVTRITYDHGHIDALKIYTTENGLVSNSTNDVYADDSEICVATPEGLTILKTREPEQAITAPPVYIVSIKCKEQRLRPDSNYILRYDQNSIQFNFTAISFRFPGDVIYQYRLAETQKWMETKNMSMDIPYLEDGSYHFQLRARILNGPWSEIRSFYFTVKPPIWKTWWFFAIYPIVCVLLVLLVMGYRASIIKQKDLEQLQIKDQVTYLEQQALQAMMNPHFIFNVMNSIQHYINNNEKHEANVYLSDFARLIRMNLDISSKRYIPLDEEVAYLKLYLSLENLRFGKNLTYKIDVDPAIDGDETMVPVMLLQPFIENAIWHGILPKKEPGYVHVEISKETDGMLKIRVCDNGIGIPVTKDNLAAGSKTHVSRGMKMTQQRLDLIGKITGHILYIHIRDAFPGEKYKGTLVEFSLPGDLS